MRRLRIHGGNPLRGKVRVPGDKSIGHRALIFGALAEGVSRIQGLPRSRDLLATRNALGSLGVKIVEEGPERICIHGVGLDGLRMPERPIECENSGTTMRLLAGVLCGQRFGTRLVGDSSLSRRPMGFLVSALRARGAHIGGTRWPVPKGSHADPDELYPPISIAPLVEGERLAPLEFHSPNMSAQLKSAVLLSGLYAEGPTVVYEALLSRDHTERMMLALGMPLQTTGTISLFDPTSWARCWEGFDWQIPGDLSSAAFLLVAGAVVPGSEIEIENVGTNPTRTGLLEVMRWCGVRLQVAPRGEGAGHEPWAEVRVRSGVQSPFRVGAELALRMIDEVPIACVLALAASGRSEIRDVQALRFKESDRIENTAAFLRAMGAQVVVLEDGLIVEGKSKLHGTRIDPQGDHRIAMAAVVAALMAEGETVVENAECIEVSYPNFVETLQSLGANIEIEEEKS
ncbi:MAG: 3-phosphoshikimate 1-carboxyvinyltransferase [Sandaracinaceae bacterium]|nr:3-phosphoshikimate 1-carboxyvinyltransferase [Sandaracinaceae bacterium]